MKKGFVLGGAVGAVIATIMVAKKKNKQIEAGIKNSTKYLDLFRQMNQYLVTKQMDKSIVDYMEKKEYRKVAIYGMSHIAQRVMDDLEDSSIEVVYGIDRRADRLTYNIPIYNPEDELPEVDVIIVTAYDYEEIYDMLSKKTDYDIISFADMIFDL